MTVAVSVIIPAHNAEGYVRQAIDSALAQTRRDIEVVVVDDGSVDATWEAVSACARRDGRVVPIRLERRGGPAVARNAAIERARGRWLALLDADDLFLPERLERLVGLAEEARADLLADNLRERDFATGRPLGLHFADDAMAHPGPLPLVELVRRDMPDTPDRSRFGFIKPVIRRDFVLRHGIRYAEEILASQDFLLYFDCVARGARLRLTPEAWYVYHLREGSISTRRDSTLYRSAANRRMLRTAKALGDRELVALLRRRQRMIDFHSFALAVERGDVAAALRHAHCGDPARMLRHARVVAGAVRRRLAGRRPGEEHRETRAPPAFAQPAAGPRPGPEKRGAWRAGGCG